MKREFGLDKAKSIIEEAVANAAIDAGKEYAKREPNGYECRGALWPYNIYGKRMMHYV